MHRLPPTLACLSSYLALDTLPLRITEQHSNLTLALSTSHIFTMSSPRRILFLTHCEQGQSNIHLAVAFELHSRAIPGLEVHLASFSELRKRFERMRGAVRSMTWTDSLSLAA